MTARLLEYSSLGSTTQATNFPRIMPPMHIVSKSKFSKVMRPLQIRKYNRYITECAYILARRSLEFVSIIILHVRLRSVITVPLTLFTHWPFVNLLDSWSITTRYSYAID